MRVLVLGAVLSTFVLGGCDADASNAPPADQRLDDAVPAASVQESPVTDLVEVPVEPAPAAQPAQPVQPVQASPPPEPRVVYRSPAPAPRPRVVTTTNVKRDAAIGAGAGAVIGAVVHKRNRWKGALVGGVVGGAAGAVVGATIDKSTRVVYP